jgi:uncharacterized delta-60 repeat protein
MKLTSTATTRNRSLIIAAIAFVAAMMLMSDSAFAIASGSVDSTFGTSGLTTAGVGTIRGEPSIGRLKDGGIVVGYDNAQYLRIMGFTSNGVFDPSFGSGGVGQVAVPGATVVGATELKVLGNGKIVVAGYVSSGTTMGFVVARFNADGTPDLTFSGDGVAVFPSPKGTAYGYGLTPVANGKLVVTGEEDPSLTVSNSATIRVNSNGTLDRTFGKSGWEIVVLKDGFKGFDSGYRVRTTTGGVLVIAGWETPSSSRNNTLVIELNPNGTLDTAFHKTGILIYALHHTGYNYAYGLTMMGKKILLGIAGDAAHPAVVRLNPNGSLDKTFGSGTGRVIYTPSSTFGNVQQIAVTSSGKIVGVGQGSGLPAFEINGNGSPYPTFGGTSFTSNGATSANGYGLLIQGSEVVVVGSVSSSSLALTRYWL